MFPEKGVRVFPDTLTGFFYKEAQKLPLLFEDKVSPNTLQTNNKQQLHALYLYAMLNIQRREDALAYYSRLDKLAIFCLRE